MTEDVGSKEEKESRWSELQELLKLTESSTRDIDVLRDKLLELRFKLLTAALVYLLILSGLFAFKAYSNFPSASAIVLVVGIIASAIMYYFGVRFAVEHRMVDNELRIEYDVHARLMSLLNDQFLRIENLGFPKVAIATAEIRTRRFSRSRSN